MHPSKHRADASSGQIASILRCVTSNPKGRVSVGDMSLTPIDCVVGIYASRYIEFIQTLQKSRSFNCKRQLILVYNIKNSTS